MFRFASLTVVAASLIGATQAQISQGFDTGSANFSMIDYAGVGDYNTVLGSGAVTWNSSGGNPGGYISITDPSSGSFMFRASSSFTGNKLAYNNGLLSFDLKASHTVDYLNDAVVVMKGPVGTFVSSIGTPTTSWARYNVPLVRTAWRIGNMSGATPSQTDWIGTIANIISLDINGEYTNGIVETTCLDNVSMEAVPEPTTVAALALGCAALFRKRRKS